MRQALILRIPRQNVAYLQRVIISLILLSGVGGDWASAEPQTEFPTDLDAVQRFIEGYHFERDIDRQNALAEFKRIEDLRLLCSSDRATFFYFPTAASSLRGHVTLAVLDTRQTLVVRDEKTWNQLMERIGLLVESPEAAESLVKDFFHLTRIHAAVWEGVDDGVNFIRGVDSIPFKPDDLEHQIERLDLATNFSIEPPAVRSVGLDYEFKGVSWQPYDGAVDEHVLHVARDGTIKYERRPLAYPYGDYHGGCMVPLDSGPPMRALEQLGRHEASASRLLVARYLAMIAQSRFVLYQGFIERNDDQILHLLRDLQLDTDARVRLEGFGAMDALGKDRAEER